MVQRCNGSWRNHGVEAWLSRGVALRYIFLGPPVGVNVIPVHLFCYIIITSPTLTVIHPPCGLAGRLAGWLAG